MPHYTTIVFFSSEQKKEEELVLSGNRQTCLTVTNQSQARKKQDDLFKVREKLRL
jgi:hypothetical protein